MPIIRIYLSLLFGILVHFYEYFSEQNNVYFHLLHYLMFVSKFHHWPHTQVLSIFGSKV